MTRVCVWRQVKHGLFYFDSEDGIVVGRVGASHESPCPAFYGDMKLGEYIDQHCAKSAVVRAVRDASKATESKP